MTEIGGQIWSCGLTSWTSPGASGGNSNVDRISWLFINNNR